MPDALSSKKWASEPGGLVVPTVNFGARGLVVLTVNFGARGPGGRDRGTKDDERSRKAIEPTVISNRDREKTGDERSPQVIMPCSHPRR